MNSYLSALIQRQAYRLVFIPGIVGLIAALTAACNLTPGRAPGDRPVLSPPDKSPTSGATPDSLESTAPVPAPVQANPEEGRLGARPEATSQATPSDAVQPGLHPLGLTKGRDGLIYVPQGYSHQRPAGLGVLLHGAGGDAQGGILLLQSLADDANLILFAPDSRASTWDVIRGGYGPDVTYIDRALAQVFSRYTIDPSHVALGGFSDGASYALSLGITNGDLFTHIMAFSPGFMAPGESQNKPRIFISHGTRDDVLPIDRCSRRIVPRLKRSGYDVDYREFDGPHTVPPEMVRAAVEWFYAGAPQR